MCAWFVCVSECVCMCVCVCVGVYVCVCMCMFTNTLYVCVQACKYSIKKCGHAKKPKCLILPLLPTNSYNITIGGSLYSSFPVSTHLKVVLLS